MDPISIAGLVVSGFSLLNSLFTTGHDILSWAEKDIEVDGEWLDIAIEKGLLPAPIGNYAWLAEKGVPTLELKGTNQVVIAHNDETRIRYRIFRGRAGDAGGRLMLVRIMTS